MADTGSPKEASEQMTKQKYELDELESRYNLDTLTPVMFEWIIAQAREAERLRAELQDKRLDLRHWVALVTEAEGQRDAAKAEAEQLRAELQRGRVWLEKLGERLPQMGEYGTALEKVKAEAERLRSALQANNEHLVRECQQILAKDKRIAEMEDALVKMRDRPELDATDGAHPAWWRSHDYVEKKFKELTERLAAELEQVKAELDELRSKYANDVGGLQAQVARHAGCETELEKAKAEAEQLRAELQRGRVWLEKLGEKLPQMGEYGTQPIGRAAVQAIGELHAANAKLDKVRAAVEAESENPRNGVRDFCEFVGAICNILDSEPAQPNPHIGSTVESLFEELGELDEVKAQSERPEPSDEPVTRAEFDALRERVEEIGRAASDLRTY
jgi:DNA repair exonuclease SbcCD ATPase subunit